jgi:hypothetical protein
MIVLPIIYYIVWALLAAYGWKNFFRDTLLPVEGSNALTLAFFYLLGVGGFVLGFLLILQWVEWLPSFLNNMENNTKWFVRIFLLVWPPYAYALVFRAWRKRQRIV